MNETDIGRLVGASGCKRDGLGSEIDSETIIEDNLEDTHHGFVVERNYGQGKDDCNNADADTGAQNRRQFFDFSQQFLKTVDDDSICFDSETNRIEHHNLIRSELSPMDCSKLRSSHLQNPSNNQIFSLAHNEIKINLCPFPTSNQVSERSLDVTKSGTGVEGQSKREDNYFSVKQKEDFKDLDESYQRQPSRLEITSENQSPSIKKKLKDGQSPQTLGLQKHPQSLNKIVDSQKAIVSSSKNTEGSYTIIERQQKNSKTGQNVESSQQTEGKLKDCEDLLIHQAGEQIPLNSQDNHKIGFTQTENPNHNLIFYNQEINTNNTQLLPRNQSFPIPEGDLKICNLELQHKDTEENHNSPGPGLAGVWKHSSLIIITLVKKFQSMLMSHNNENKFRNLEKNHFEVIGDKSVYFPYYRKYLQDIDLQYKKKIKGNQNAQKAKKKHVLKHHNPIFGENKAQLEILNEYTNNLSNRSNSDTDNTQSCNVNWIFTPCFEIFKNVRVIPPNSHFRIGWNILMFWLLLLNFFIIPLKVSFSTFAGPIMLTYSSGCLFLFDMIINFNSAYFSKGLIITDRKKIVKSYLKKNFIVDFTTLIVYVLIQFSYQIEAGALIKVLKLAPLIENFEEILNLRQRGQAILSLSKLIIFVLMCAHILGCSFFLVARLEQVYFPDSQNWIDLKNLWEAYWIDQYIASLYWSVVTMITVGYGDITPVNTQERLFVIVVMLISCGIFAYSLNSIGRILEELSKRDSIFRDNISLVTSYLKQVRETLIVAKNLLSFFSENLSDFLLDFCNKRGISYHLQLRIRKYFQYLHRENLEDNEKSEGLMDLLPSSLQNELGLEMYVKIINDQKVFKLNYSQKFIMELSLKMKEKRLGPEEVIFQEGDYLDKLYFLIKGQVELFVNVKDADNNSITSVSVVNKGRLLGQNAFFTQLPSSTGTRCINVTSLVFIARDDFTETIKKFPKDYEKFCMLRDNLQINNISRGMGTKCHLCGSFNHSFQNCHLIRYSPMKEKIIIMFNKKEQGRDPSFIRNKRVCPTSSARIAHEYLKLITLNYLLEFNPEDSSEEGLMETVDHLKRYYAIEHKKWKEFGGKSLSEIEDEKLICLVSPPIKPSSPNSLQHLDYNQLNDSPVLDDKPIFLNSNNGNNNINGNPAQIGPSLTSLDSGNPSLRKRKNTLSFLGADGNAKDSVSTEANLVINTNNYIPNNMNSSIKRNRFKEYVEPLNQQISSQHIIQQNTLIERSMQSQHSPPKQQVSFRNGDNNNEGAFVSESQRKRQNLSQQRRKSYLNCKSATIRPSNNSKWGNNWNQDNNNDNPDTENNSELQQNPNNISFFQTIQKQRNNRRRQNILWGAGLSEDQIRKKSFSDLENFDRYMIFEIYFIEGNINRILEVYNKNFIHFKTKEPHCSTAKKRMGKKQASKQKISRNERSMNVLSTKILQKRSQGGMSNLLKDIEFEVGFVWNELALELILFFKSFYFFGEVASMTQLHKQESHQLESQRPTDTLSVKYNEEQYSNAITPFNNSNNKNNNQSNYLDSIQGVDSSSKHNNTTKIIQNTNQPISFGDFLLKNENNKSMS